MKISVHVERLVLDGIEVLPRQRPALQAAVEAELGRLLAEGGLNPALRGGGAVPSLRAGGIQLAAGEAAAGLGRQIAAAVYGGIGR